MFGNKTQKIIKTSNRLSDFAYLDSSHVYMDSACQSMRPQPVIDSLIDYYTNYNACGGRVKYAWGQKVDSAVESTREAILDFLKFSKKDYVCSFTLNTTYGINLVLGKIPINKYLSVVTSEIEHNSVFLPTIELSKRLDVKRQVLKRDVDGNLDYNPDQLKKSVVVLSAVSNIDGRQLNNIRGVVKDAQNAGGIVVIDAAQAMAHNYHLLQSCGADVICFSAHKMYSSSLGAIVISKDLLKHLNNSFTGGGMVSAVSEQDYSLLPDDIASWLEPGLQAFGEIVALGRAIDWLKTIKPFGLSPKDYINKMSVQLYEGLSNYDGLTMYSQKASPVISLYPNKMDAHRLAIFLSGANIMVRSGYFCCHYYLLNKQNTPPLVRFSIGLHTTKEDIETAISTTIKLTKG